jgi:ribonucleoside-triphosphate reductase
MPYTKVYLGHFDNHFSTIGIVGMNEACLNFLGKGIGTPEGKDFTIQVLNFMRETLKQFQEETGQLYNLEATPAESTSYRLARLDRAKYPRILTAGTDKYPFLSNSTQLNVDATRDIFEALEHQKDLQPLYTGGTIFHAFLPESIDGKTCKKLVRKISETKLPYFSITPTFSVCHSHGFLKGEVHKCPECGENTEVYSRIVGYLRPVATWNDGKKQEFKERVTYSEGVHGAS